MAHRTDFKEHDIYLHLNKSPKFFLQPRDIVKAEGIFEEYNDRFIDLIKHDDIGINYSDRKLAQLSPEEMEKLEKNELFIEIKDKLKDFSGIVSKNGSADRLRVNVYHPGLGFNAHSDYSKTEHYFFFEGETYKNNTGKDWVEPETSAITAAVCFGSRRTVIFKPDKKHGTILRSRFEGKIRPSDSIDLDLKGGDFYAFSRGFRFSEEGKLMIKGVNSTHTHCVVANSESTKDTQGDEIHVSLVMFGCQSVEDFEN